MVGQTGQYQKIIERGLPKTRLPSSWTKDAGLAQSDQGFKGLTFTFTCFQMPKPFFSESPSHIE
jgi:hypothetical protein